MKRPIPRPMAAGSAVLALAMVLMVLGPVRGNQPAGLPPPADPARWTIIDGPLPVLVDATDAWGLRGVRPSSGVSASGGAAAGDLDGDGHPDLAVGAGRLVILFGDGGARFSRARGAPGPAVRDVTSVGIADVDRDGAPDLLVGTGNGRDLVIWGTGDRRMRDLSARRRTALPSAGVTSGLVAADLAGDDRTDLLRVGDATAVLVQRRGRRFDAVGGGPEGGALAAEVADLEGDGRLDIWLATPGAGGADDESIRARPTGGADTIRTDGVAVTLADLGGDPALDAYVSGARGRDDLLVRDRAGYTAAEVAGAPAISAASGAADLNLDGRLDLVVTGGDVQRTDGPGGEPSLLLGRGNGEFIDVWRDLALPWRGAARGLTLADLDADGDDDIVIVTDDGLRVYRNDATGASVSVAAAAACPTAGAVVRVSSAGRTTSRLLAPQSLFGTHGGRAIIGTRFRPATVRVSWPGNAAVERSVPVGERRELVVPCPR